MPHFNPIQINYYGNIIKEHSDCLLVCPHGDDGQEFLTHYPEFLDICPLAKDTIYKYLKLEHDFATEELSIEIAQQLAKTQPDLKTTIINIKVPRAIVDCNRTASHAVRFIFDHHKNQDFFKKTLALHQDVLTKIKSYFQLLSPEGIFIDIHSMSPYTPKGGQISRTQAAQESVEDIDHYLSLFCHKENYGTRRYPDIITQSVGEAPTADPRLFLELKNALQSHSIQFEINQPYNIEPHILTAQYMQDYSGIALDIPKDYLSLGRAEDADFDITNLKTSPTKITRIASPISQAISRVLTA